MDVKYGKAYAYCPECKKITKFYIEYVERGDYETGYIEGIATCQECATDYDLTDYDIEIDFIEDL